jgi:hypothetical protein
MNSVKLHSLTRKMIAVIKIAILMLASLACAAQANPTEPPHEKTVYELKSTTHVMIFATGVGGLLNKFILAKKGTDVCAIRFTDFHRDYDEKPATLFQSGTENKYADYEWFYQGDGSGDFTKANVMSGKGRAHSGPTIGFGHNITLWRSPDKWWVECGNAFSIWWAYPTGLGFQSYVNGGFRDDIDLELAGTNWSVLNDINIHNSKLHWVKLSTQSLRTVEIPLSELP